MTNHLSHEGIRWDRRWRLLLLTAILVAGAVLAWWLADRIDRGQRYDLLAQARLVAGTVNLERVQALTGTEADLQSPPYLRLKEQLAAVRAVNPKCRFVYLMGRSAEGSIFFFADSEPMGSQDESPAGQVYDEASDDFHGVFDTREATVEGPVSDRWGTWVTALVPLDDPWTGDVVAVLGMDMDARDWKWDVAARSLLPTGMAALALLAVFLVGSSLLSQRARLKGPPPRWMVHIEPALTVAVGLVLTLFAAWLAQDESVGNQANSFRHLAESRTAAFAEVFSDLRDVELEGLAMFCENKDVTAEDFRRYVEHLTRNRSVQAWGWIPSVPAADKEPFEQAARSAGMDGFEIWQRDPAGNRMPDLDREVYYPVFRVQPEEENWGAMGFDLGSEPIRRAAIEEALRTGLTTASHPVTLVQETPNQKGMLVLRPVFADAQGTQPRGLALAVLRLNDALASTGSDDLVANELILAHSHKPSQRLACSWTTNNPPSEKLIVNRPVFAFGQTFIVTAHAGPDFLRVHPTRAGLIVGLMGLVLTLSMAFVLSVWLRRRQVLEEQVQERTTALRESEENHRLLTEHAISAIALHEIVLDDTGRPVDYVFLSANAAFERHTGMKPSDVIGRRVTEVLPGIEKTPFIETYGHVALTGEPIRFEQYSEPLMRHYDIHAYRVGEGRFAAVFTDITERKRVEVEMKSARDQYQSLVDNIPGITYRCKHDKDWTMLYMSNVVDPLTGYPASDFIWNAVRTYESVIHPEDTAFVAERITAAVAEGRAWDIEYRICHKHGGIRWVHEKGRGIPAEDGNVEYLDGFILDITERKAAEKELLKFRTAVEQSSDGIALADMDGNILFANSAWAGMHGYSVDELIGRHLSLFHTREQMEKEVIPFNERLIASGSSQGEIGHVRKDGTHLPTQMTTTAMKSADGTPFAMLGIARDITEDVRRREREELANKFRSLVAEASARFVDVHDSRTFDEAVDGVLASLGRLFGLDRGYLFRFSEDLSTMDNTHEWYAPGITAQKDRIQQFPPDRLPWWKARMLEMKPVHVPEVGSLPPEAAAEKEEFQSQGIQSLICFPICGDRKNLIAFMGFDAVRTPHAWQEEQVAMLQVLAEVIGSTIARMEAASVLARELEARHILLDNIQTQVWYLTDDHTYGAVNRAHAEFNGVEIEDLAFRNMYDLFPEDIVEVCRQGNIEVFTTGKPVRSEEWVPHVSGEQRLISILKSPKLRADGTVEYVVCSAEDITEQKQAQEALKKERDLFTAGPVFTIEWDMSAPWPVRTVSANVEMILGYSPAEMTSPDFRYVDLIHPEDLERTSDEVRHHSANHIDTYEQSYRMKTKAGEYRWFYDFSKLVRDDNGILTGIRGYMYDQTAQKTTEQALAAQKERLDNIIKGTHVGTWEWNVQTGETVFNERWAEILGYSLAEISPASIETWMNFAHPDDLKKSRELLERHFKGELDYYECEARMRHKSGEWVWVLDRGRVAAWTEDGKPLMMMGTHQDVTGRKKAEAELVETNRELESATARANEMAVQAELASMAKSEFLANMSHEIRTPMNGVIGMTGLLLDTELSEDQRRYAEIVKSSGESLLGLINDILDFSKIEAGKLDLEILDFDLGSLLDDFAAALALRAQDKGLEMICAADPDVPTALTGDPGRLRQVLTNLAGNAVKFTHQGEVTVRVSRVVCDECRMGHDEDSGLGSDSCLLRFSVRDTGIGIPEEKIGMLFQQFSQVDASTTRQYGGTGLGLAISKELAEMMGGTVGVTSVEGQGSEFWFTAHFGIRADIAREEGLPSNLAGVRVLIVDDNATSREILVTRLSSWGMRPEEASSGSFGLQALYRALGEGDPFRLAVIDMQMPLMDGEAVGRAITVDPKLAETRLVMLTSLGARGDARRFQEIGFSGYAVKPIRHEELKGVLSHSLAGGVDGAPQPIVTRHTAREALPDFAERKARILLAEDNITNQQVALGILKKLGLTADAVANGREAVKAIKTLPYDLVLMDVQMPEMDGAEATRRIRSQEAEGSRQEPGIIRPIPIIAMTAHAMQGDRAKFLEAGMNDYVSKPVSPQALAEVLEKWLLKGTDVRNQEPALKRQETEVDRHPSPVIWDRAAMVERLMGDDKLARTVLEGFLTDIPRQIEALRGFLETGDAASAQRQAHTIKGAAANVSAEALRSLAFELEKAGNAGEIERMKTRLDELTATFEAFNKEVADRVGELSVEG